MLLNINLKMSWFPDMATRAFCETINLRKRILERRRPHGSLSRQSLEPASAEFIAALAAGINSRTILQIGCGLSTIALAAAAQVTGGILVSIQRDGENQAIVSYYMKFLGLSDFVEFIVSEPSDVIPLKKDINFAFFTGDPKNYIRLFDILNLRHGAIVVADNALNEASDEYIRHVRRQPGIDSSTLPLARGIEVTKILSFDVFNSGRVLYSGPDLDDGVAVHSENCVHTSSEFLNANLVGEVRTKPVFSCASKGPEHAHVGGDDAHAAEQGESTNNANAWTLGNILEQAYVNKDDAHTAKEAGLLKKVKVLTTERALSLELEKEASNVVVEDGQMRPSDTSCRATLNHEAGAVQPTKLQDVFTVKGGGKTLGDHIVEDIDPPRVLDNGNFTGSLKLHDSDSAAINDDPKLTPFSPDSINREDASSVFNVQFRNCSTETEVMVTGLNWDMLLTDITMAFNDMGISVKMAKISTYDNLIEDIFYVIDAESKAPIQPSQWDATRDRILQRISGRS